MTEEPSSFGEEMMATIARIAASGMNPMRIHDHVAENAKPSEEQRNLKPGDLVVVSYSVTSDDDFLIAEVLDASHYAETFPDWLERLDIKSRLLVNYYAQHTPQGDIGWVPRAKCMKVTQREHWDELHQMILAEKDPGNTPPVWLMELYAKRMAGLAEANNPDHDVAVPITCGECGSTAILLHRRVTSDAVFPVGHAPSAPDKYEAFDCYDHEMSEQASLDCQACGASTPLVGEEFVIHESLLS